MKRDNMLAKAGFVTVLMALAVLCVSVVAQENTAEDSFKKGQKLRMNGSLEEALGALNKATLMDPENADAWQYKALTLRDLQRFNESIEAFDKAIELNPQGTEARVEKAGVLMVIGRSSEAAEVLDVVTGQAPESPEERLDQSIAWRSRGNILVEKGSYEEALKAYDRAIELGSGQPLGAATASLNKGLLLMRLER
jgi:tetratricopeptide (TPR) repeat protein